VQVATPLAPQPPNPGAATGCTKEMSPFWLVLVLVLVLWLVVLAWPMSWS